MYENVNKKASKLRHAMASQGKQGKPGKVRQSQAKPGIEDKLSLIEAL